MKAKVLRYEEMLGHRRSYTQRLNPGSLVRIAGLSRRAGLSRIGVSMAWLPPGKESFAYHAHRYEEEWVFVVKGKGVAIVEEGELALGPGDFMAFPAPGVPHLLRNDGEEDLVYLMGGENAPLEVIDYPKLGKSYLLLSEERKTAFYELVDPKYPFGPADE